MPFSPVFTGGRLAWVVSQALRGVRVGGSLIVFLGGPAVVLAAWTVANSKTNPVSQCPANLPRIATRREGASAPSRCRLRWRRHRGRGCRRVLSGIGCGHAGRGSARRRPVPGVQPLEKQQGRGHHKPEEESHPREGKREPCGERTGPPGVVPARED